MLVAFMIAMPTIPFKGILNEWVNPYNAGGGLFCQYKMMQK